MADDKPPAADNSVSFVCWHESEPAAKVAVARL